MNRSVLMALSFLMVPVSGIYATMMPTTFGLPASQMSRAHPGLAHAVTLGDLTLTGVYPRIITPNGDGYNDKAGFHFDNPEDLPVSGEVFDLSGAKVADLQPGTTGDAASLLLWDGKDTSGKTVAGGIYIYQIEFQGKTASGTVAVAR